MYRPSQTPHLTLSSTRVAKKGAENRRHFRRRMTAPLPTARATIPTIQYPDTQPPKQRQQPKLLPQLLRTDGEKREEAREKTERQESTTTTANPNNGPARLRTSLFSRIAACPTRTLLKQPNLYLTLNQGKGG